jgi:1-deoxy-D-xylulose-5-phosphate reductoisomerase
MIKASGLHTKAGPNTGQRRLAVLGSTGSIGVNTLAVAKHLGPSFRITGLAASRNWKQLAQQAREVHPAVVILSSPETEVDSQALRAAVEKFGSAVDTGPQAMDRLVERPDVDMVCAAVVGAAGLSPVLKAAAAGKWIALANKEALVVAGGLVMPLAGRSGSQVLPVDSEHSAIFQALRSGQAHEIQRIILTASGGPFRTWTPEQCGAATVEQALNHPNWRMGPKITIDSATMMNKALEIIEAHWLFNLPADRIEVLIHPESIIHSMIEFVDGSIIAQLGTPDMRTAIQYALTHPERYPGCSNRLDWSKISHMHFEQPQGRFPALDLGFEVVRRGGTSGAVVNAANEVANALFREGKISFGQIVPRAQQVLQKHLQNGFNPAPTLEALLAADRWARQEAMA